MSTPKSIPRSYMLGAMAGNRKCWLACKPAMTRPLREKITVENGEDAVVVTFEERTILEDQQIRKLDRALMPIIGTNRDKRLVLNFIKVKFVSSSLLGLLVKVHKRVIEAGGHLQLCNLDGKVRRVFELTQLVRVFDIVASES